MQYANLLPQPRKQLTDRRTVPRRLGLLIPLLTTLVLQGCATFYEGKYPWSQGWRDVQVEQVLRGSEIDHPGFWSCVRGRSAEAVATGRFALVSYLQMGKRKRSMMPLSSTDNAHVGDRLYANVSTCEIHRRGGAGL